MASICCSPPESVPASWSWRSRSRGNIVERSSRVLLHLRLLARARRRTKAPRMRLSRTDCWANTRRPSGHVGDASAHHLVGRGGDEVLALEDDGAARRSEQAGDGPHHRGLARAVAPDDRHELALGDLETQPLERADLPVVDDQVLNGEERAHAGTAVLVGCLPEIGLDDDRIGLDLRRSALGDLLAEVEHRHVVGDGHHHVHVVLDEEDGDASGLHPLDERVDLLDLARGEAGRRLVEEQQARSRAPAPGRSPDGAPDRRTGCVPDRRRRDRGRRTSAGRTPGPEPPAPRAEPAADRNATSNSVAWNDWCSPTITFSSTVRSAKSCRFWNVRAMPAAPAATASAAARSSPKLISRPAVGV